MKEFMKIIPDKEEVAFDAIPLATKPPSIVEWKIMLKSFDREDLETLWKLVKAKHGYTRPEEGYERVLWGDLKTMFEHHVEDAVWRNLRESKVLVWKLFDSCGVHFVRTHCVQKEDKSKNYMHQCSPEDHMADFHHLDDARDIWLAVKARFGGNDESKKMRKSMLKQEFSEFRVSESEGLHKGLNRTLEIDVKGGSSYDSRGTSAPTHSAFISAASTNSKMSYPDQSHSTTFTSASSSPTASSNVMENVLHSFVAESDPQQQITYEDFDQIGKLDLEELDIKWQMAMLSVRINRFEKKAGRKMKFNNKDAARFDKKKVKCKDYEMVLLQYMGRMLEAEKDATINATVKTLVNIADDAKLEKMNDKVQLEETKASDKSSDSETTDFASCVSSVKTSSSKTNEPLASAPSSVDFKPVSKTADQQSNSTNDDSSFSFKEKINSLELHNKPMWTNVANIPSFVPKAASVPAGSRNRPTSVPAGSRNRPTFVPAGSRNRPTNFQCWCSFGESKAKYAIGSKNNGGFLINLHGLLITDPQGMSKLYSFKTKQPAGTQDTNIHAGTQEDSDSECDEQVILVPSFPSNSFSGPKVLEASEMMESGSDYAEELARLQQQAYEANATAEKHLSQADLATSRNVVPTGKVVSAADVFDGHPETSTPVCTPVQD
ncbi:hypothetical protein Tco_1143540 [Tanacetum coccineum]